MWERGEHELAEFEYDSLKNDQNSTKEYITVPEFAQYDIIYCG